MLKRPPSSLSRTHAIAAAACAAGLGLVLLGAWYVQSIDSGLNDTSNYRAAPSQALVTIGEILALGGLGAVVALHIFRSSRWRLWCALAVVAVVAVAVPWRTTDWSLLFDQRRFEQISPPSHLGVSTYQAFTWTASSGQVGRTFVRTFDVLGSGRVSADDLLVHYRKQLPTFACAKSGNGIVCRRGSRLFAAEMQQDGTPQPPVRTSLTTCGDGRDPRGFVDAPPFPCGATGSSVRRL